MLARHLVVGAVAALAWLAPAHAQNPITVGFGMAPLYGVRLDTAETLVDASIVPQMGTFKPTGVNPQLVRNVRAALDGEGFDRVKIVVSGGFNVEKIRQFEEEGVPVDMYGVGSSLFQGRFDFTADVVQVDGKPCAKVGRKFRPNPRLERVE